MALRNKKIKTVMVGLGNIAFQYENNPAVLKRIKYPTHFSVLKKDQRFSLVGVSDINAQSRQRFAKKTGGKINIYSDHRTLVKTEKPDLVVVATPTPTHYKICLDLINLGVKNILCEKPISYSLMEAKKIVSLAKKKRVNLVFNYLRSFDQSYNQLIKAIRKNQFGQIISINVKYSNGIFNTATHLINILQKMFGKTSEITAYPEEKKYPEVDPTISFKAKFGKTLTFFEGISGSSYRILEIDLLFTAGRLKMVSDQLEEYRPFLNHGFSFMRRVNPRYKININYSLVDVYNNIYDQLTNNKESLCPADQALATLVVASKVVSSVK